MISKKLAWRIIAATVMLIVLAAVYIIIPAIVASLFSLIH